MAGLHFAREGPGDPHGGRNPLRGYGTQYRRQKDAQCVQSLLRGRIPEDLFLRQVIETGEPCGDNRDGALQTADSQRSSHVTPP